MLFRVYRQVLSVKCNLLHIVFSKPESVSICLSVRKPFFVDGRMNLRTYIMYVRLPVQKVFSDFISRNFGTQVEVDE